MKINKSPAEKSDKLIEKAVPFYRYGCTFVVEWLYLYGDDDVDFRLEKIIPLARVNNHLSKGKYKL